MSSPIPLYTAEQVKNGEVDAARAKSLPMYELMTRAGQAVFDVMMHQYTECQKVLIVCGGGNNGGDGYVVGKLALEAGLQVTLWQVVEETKLKGDALTAYQDYCAAGGDTNEPDLSSEIDYDCIVDALFGTGLSGSVRPDGIHLINRLNRVNAPIVAVDLPSGLSSNSGQVLGACVKADHTGVVHWA